MNTCLLSTNQSHIFSKSRISCFSISVPLSLWKTRHVSSAYKNRLQFTHCVKSAQIRSFFSAPYFPVFSPNMGNCGPEKTPYLDTFNAVTAIGTSLT